MSAAEALFILPLRYEDRTQLVPIGALQAGARAVVEGEILLNQILFRGRRQLIARLGDGTGTLTLRFFYFSNAQREGLARGTLLRCYGEVRRGPEGLELVHPEYRRVAALGQPLEQTLTPIYPASMGLTQGRCRALVDRGLKGLARAYAITVWLPAQPDATAAENTIRRVFGYIDRVEEPKSAAGTVVFHDAWPRKWPTLTTDILNSHHHNYYEKGEPPGAKASFGA